MFVLLVVLAMDGLGIVANAHKEDVMVGNVDFQEDGQEIDAKNENNRQRRNRRQSRRRRKRNRRRLTHQRIDCEADCLLLGVHRRDVVADSTAESTVINADTLLKEEAMNCILHCMSPECYMQLYGSSDNGGNDDEQDRQKGGRRGPLEPGEIDVETFVDFELCIEQRQLKDTKFGAAAAAER